MVLATTYETQSPKDGTFFVDLYELLLWIYACTGFGAGDLPKKWQVHLFRSYRAFFYVNTISVQCQIMISLVHATNYQDQILLLGMTVLTIVLPVRNIILQSSAHQIRDLDSKLRRNLHQSHLKYAEWCPAVKRKFDDEALAMLIGFLFIGTATLIVYFFPAMFIDKELPLPHVSSRQMDALTFRAFLVWHIIFMLLFAFNFVSIDMTACGYFLRLCSQQELIIFSVDYLTETFPYINFKEYVPEYGGYEEDVGGAASSTKTPSFKGKSTPSIDLKNKFHSFDHNFAYDRDLMIEIRNFMRKQLEHYLEFKKQVKTVERIFKYPLFLQLFAGCFVAALLGAVGLMADVSDPKVIRQILFCVCVLFDLYLFCYCGTKLTEQNRRLSHSLYNCPWYEMDISTRKLVLQCLQMLQPDLRVKAGTLAPINLSTYRQILNNTYNIIAVIRNIF